MVALRTRPRGVVAPFGLCTFALALLPAPIGTQDLAALFSDRAAERRQPAPYAATLHLATYSFPQPVGTGIPPPSGYRLASLDPRALDVTGSLPGDGGLAGPPRDRPREFPTVDRRLKGDALLPPVLPPAPVAALSPGSLAREAHAALAPAPELAVVPESGLLPEDVNADAPAEDSVWPDLGPVELSASHNPAMDTARLYFGADSLDAPPGALDRPAAEPEAAIPLPARRPAETGGKPVASTGGGETIAGKGDVTGQGRRPLSPAERLGLGAKARAKAERCLANAVYFESRGEAVRGQIAVAQVVMNRVFSEFYPDNVCNVVYQNAHRHNACQFTFACDGIRDVVTEPDAWQRAKRIAKDTLDGKLWLDDIGKATHYHAYWVRPWWIGTMRKLHKIGVHTFYRPRRWGDGADEPIWGDAKTTAALAKKL